MTKPPTDDEAQRIAHEFAGDDPDCGDGQHGAFCSGLAARIREYGDHRVQECLALVIAASAG